MAEDFDWDDEDFDPDAGFSKQQKADEWEGEDEDLDLKAIKEKVEEKNPPEAPKEKKSKEERLAEKKAKRRAEELEKAQVETQPLSEEEKLAEKIKLEQLQKDADLEVTKELFGVSAGPTIDSMHPSSSEEFDTFAEALSNKITQYETNPHYIGMLTKLIPRICAGLDVEDLRKMSSQLSVLASEKQKAKAPKSKKKGKGTQHGAKLAVGKAAKKVDAAMEYDEDLGAEFDDFM